MTVWNGVFPAVTTKLHKDGSLDLSAMQASVERQVRNGVSGIIVLPMLGENAAITLAEKEQVIRAAKEAIAGKVPLLSGLAEASGDAAVDVARKLKSFGAEGLMAFPALGYKSDVRETAAWYRQVAGATDLPIMIYNNPIAYGVDVTPETLDLLVDVPEIVAFKEETGDIRRVTDMYIAHGDRFAIFCGVDDLIVESMSLGVTGWVSGMTNVWPAQCVHLFRLCAQGKYDEARTLYRKLTPAFHLDTHVKLVQYIKLAENVVYGAPEWVRSPRLPLVGGERNHVISTIEAAVKDLDLMGLKSS